jgi:dolichol-phosphate mannosyltransferase
MTASVTTGTTKSMTAGSHTALLSVVIPARNESENLEPTIEEIISILDEAEIPFEIVIVNDGADPATQRISEQLSAKRSEVRVVPGDRISGFGRTVRVGLSETRGDVIALVMADRSDNPHDLVRYYEKIEEGYDCVFGSRFRKGSHVTNYPMVKMVANRVGNKLIQLLFWTRFNDLSNAFKAYRREVILECGPYSSSHFNLTIEMSLSALIRQYHIAEIPIDWRGRTWGASSLSLRQMGRRYLSVLLKLFFERMLIADDILEERLGKRGQTQDRYARLEARIAELEKMQSSDADAPSDPGTVTTVANLKIGSRDGE